MGVITQEEKIKEIIERSVAGITEGESLIKKLRSGRSLRVKFGIDPTGPQLHLGRAMQFWKLRQFQELGHKIVLIIGDITAQIGDASDKDAMRKPLSQKEITANLKDYRSQIGRIINIKKAEVRYNSEWLGKLKAADLLRLTMNFTAQQMIQRRNFKERWDAGKPIGLHELSYPVLQGYDSVMVKADVELGGTDQLFNLLAGRIMQKAFGHDPQDIMTLKMLPGLDGRKMSTSWGNVVNITDEPGDMFGKIMSLKDDLILPYFELCTLLPPKTLHELKGSLENGANPRDIKIKLAEEIAALYNGPEIASRAKGDFEKIFTQKELVPESITLLKISCIEREVILAEALSEISQAAGLNLSHTELKRLISQKAVEVNEIPVTDSRGKIKLQKGDIVRIGKRRFFRMQ